MRDREPRRPRLAIVLPTRSLPLAPAKAGTQNHKRKPWIPAYVGMSGRESHAEWKIRYVAATEVCRKSMKSVVLAGRCLAFEK
jgi:hypothetical protein